MTLATIIPAPWRIGLLALLSVVLMAFGWVKGAQHVQGKWDADKGARAQAIADALLARVAENKTKAARQAAVNQAITEGKDHEIATLTARLNAAPRLRVGPAICGRAGSAGPAEAAGASRGDDADSSGRLVREDVDRDLKSLILAVEMDLATGRACQAFVKDLEQNP